MAKRKQEREGKLLAFFDVLTKELADVQPRSPQHGFAIERQLSRARKRARFVRPELKQKAIEGFISTNAAVGHTVVSVDRDVLANARHFSTYVLERLATRRDPTNIQVSLDHSLLYDLWRYGPGAANGITGTHAAEKVSQRMTCTAPSVPFVAKLRRSNPYFRLYDEVQGSLGIDVVKGSRLSTVPKNEDTVRTIAIEPLGNMAMQLAAGRYLEMALESIGLDITKQQPLNKALALRGSIDGSLATIDLSKASDMISPALVRACMPEPWYRLLMDLRSPEIEIPGFGSHHLNMISTMGNGFTFPLMTLVLVSLIYGFRCLRGGPSLFIDWGSTAVFGDDIIIPSEEYLGFTEVLQQAGLLVNHEKSYSVGPFRESCGGDYYEGVDVTPFYVKSLAEPSEVYAAINQVFEWSARHATLLVGTLRYLKSLLPDQRVFFVPEWMGASDGFRTPRVARKYPHLYVKPQRRKLSPESPFAMMLACGGYIESSNSDMFYTPRPFKTKWKVGKSRLPRGYLDGRDPLTRSNQISSFIDAYSFVLE